MYPKKLYKYKKFDKYTCKMLRNGELFLCSAKKLDDQFDCAVNIIHDKYKNMDDDEMKNLSFKMSKEQMVNYCPINDENIKLINKLGGFFKDLFELKFDENPGSTNNVEEIFETITNFQEKIGVGSLAISKTNQVLWNMYANNYKGFCIEYEIPSNVKNLYKVSYGKNKNNDILETFLRYVLLEIYSKFFGIKNEVSFEDEMKKLALIKFKEWSFQKEWRFIGEPGKYVYLKIKAVYLGNNISKKHEEKILTIAKKKKFKVYKSYNDYKDLKIKFNRVL